MATKKKKKISRAVADVLKGHRAWLEAKSKERLAKKKKRDDKDGDVPLSESLAPARADRLPKEVQEKMTEDDCVALLRGMAEADPDRVISRNYFRTHGRIKESTWNQFFGTFEEFKRQAGIKLSRQQHKLEREIAKHASVDHYRALEKERIVWGNKYEKPSHGRFKTILVAADFHDIDCDPFALRIFLDVARRSKGIIDLVCLAGDLFDLPEFSKWQQDPRDWNVAGRIRFVHNQILRPLRKILGSKIQIDLIEGNHESYDAATTYVLCRDEWVLGNHIIEDHDVASYDITTGEISFSKPTKVSFHDDVPLYSVRGQLSDELVSDKHRVDVFGRLVKVSSLDGVELKQNDFRLSGQYAAFGVGADLDYLRLITWLVMDGTMLRRKCKNSDEYQNNCRLQWKLSKKKKIDTLVGLLTRMGIEFTYRSATKSSTNKLQPYYICIYGEAARDIWDYLGGAKELPHSWGMNLNREELDVVIETIEQTDGHRSYEKTLGWRTTSAHDRDVIQMSCVLNGRLCKFSTGGKSGFGGGHPQYLISFYDSVPNRRVDVSKASRGRVVSITTENDTLITRRNGKVSFTGNSRLLRHLGDQTTAMKGLLADLHGFDIPKLLGLNEFEINYIGRGSLCAWTKRDIEKELEHNFKVYYDSVLAHHFPKIGMKKGLPGFSGHHHKLQVWPLQNPLHGPGLWYQLGSMCVRAASYADGTPWTNGFALCHVDTQTKRSTFEYFDVSDHCYAGGKLYLRQENENVVPIVPGLKL